MNQSKENQKHLHILVVDDSQPMRLLVTSFLKKKSNIGIIKEVETGNQALEYCQLHLPDIVLMDISLSGENGTVVCKKIKQEYPKIKVYLWSAFDKSDYEDFASELLADGFINKSNLKNELQEMIDKESVL